MLRFKDIWKESEVIDEKLQIWKIHLHTHKMKLFHKMKFVSFLTYFLVDCVIYLNCPHVLVSTS